MKNSRRAGGFTLVELILALFVAGLFMSAVYLTMISGQKSSAGVERKVAAQQDVRAALEIMAIEIGMASHNPNFVPAEIIWNALYKGIPVATPTAITVQMDLGGAGTGGRQEDGIIGANETISYAYDVPSQTITRSIDNGTANPFLGGGPNAAAGTKTVNVINSATNINNGAGVPAIFRYYDTTGAELYPGTNPAKIPDIRRIDITLAVQTEERDPSTNAYRQMIYSTSVFVRNHAIQ